MPGSQRQRMYWRLEGDFSWSVWRAGQLFINIFNRRAGVVGDLGVRPRDRGQMIVSIQ